MLTKQKRGKKIGLRFSETMSGHLAEGVEDFEAGEKRGKEQGNSLFFDVAIEIESMRQLVAEQQPDKLEFFECLYEARFRRMYDQWHDDVRPLGLPGDTPEWE